MTQVYRVVRVTVSSGAADLRSGLVSDKMDISVTCLVPASIHLA